MPEDCAEKCENFRHHLEKKMGECDSYRIVCSNCENFQRKESWKGKFMVKKTVDPLDRPHKMFFRVIEDKGSSEVWVIFPNGRRAYSTKEYWSENYKFITPPSDFFDC